MLSLPPPEGPERWCAMRSQQSDRRSRGAAESGAGSFERGQIRRKRGYLGLQPYSTGIQCKMSTHDIYQRMTSI